VSIDPGTALGIAVPAAILGAAGFGLASAAQQRATHEVELAPTLSPRLLVDLTKRPMWLLGLAATGAALVLQLVALAYGPLAVVQPLLVTGVAFAAGFTAMLSRRRSSSSRGRPPASPPGTSTSGPGCRWASGSPSSWSPV
jgi:hypothetical protein